MRSVLKEEMGKHHAEMVNKMLLTDSDTVAGNNFESLDRITGNDGGASGGLTSMETGSASADHCGATDLDIYSIDRSGNSWSNAVVNCGSDQDSANRRTMSLDQLDDVFQLVWELGGNPKVILTGYDTLMRLQQFAGSAKIHGRKACCTNIQRC